MSLFREMTPQQTESSANDVSTAKGAVAQPPPPRKAAFFQDADDSDSDNDILVVEQAAGAAKQVQKSAQPTLASEEMTISDDDDDNDDKPDMGREKDRVRRKPATSAINLKRPSFDFHYFGGERLPRLDASAEFTVAHWSINHADILVDAYAIYSQGTFCDLKNNEAVTITRLKPKPSVAPSKNAKKEDTIVR